MEQLQKPSQAVLVHDIDLDQLGNQEKEQTTVVCDRCVASPGLVELLLGLTRHLLLVLDLLRK